MVSIRRATSSILPPCLNLLLAPLGIFHSSLLGYFVPGSSAKSKGVLADVCVATSEGYLLVLLI